MPTTPTGRGAQVIVDPGSLTAKAIRGSYASTMEANLAQVRSDRLSGAFASGDTTADGTTVTGGAATDLVTSTNTARILGLSNSLVTHTGDTATFVFATIMVPARAMGPNGILRITTLWSATGTAQKNCLVALSPVAGGGGVNVANQAITTQLGLHDIRHIRNANATNAQRYSNSVNAAWGGMAGANLSAAINTDSITYVNLSGVLTNAGDSVALESYLVELLRFN